jgi:hypothetical protein
LRRRPTSLAKLSPNGMAVAKVAHRQTNCEAKRPFSKDGAFCFGNV